MEFRNLVKTEIARISTSDDVRTAQLEKPQAAAAGKPELVTAELPRRQARDLSAFPDILSYSEPARADMPRPTKSAKLPKPLKPEPAAEEPPKPQPRDFAAFLDSLSNSVDSGNLLIERQLTTADLMDYAKRTYQNSHPAGSPDSSL